MDDIRCTITTHLDSADAVFRVVWKHEIDLFPRQDTRFHARRIHKPEQANFRYSGSPHLSVRILATRNLEDGVGF